MNFQFNVFHLAGKETPSLEGAIDRCVVRVLELGNLIKFAMYLLVSFSDVGFDRKRRRRV
jgi:hypothetical protein